MSETFSQRWWKNFEPPLSKSNNSYARSYANTQLNTPRPCKYSRLKENSISAPELSLVLLEIFPM